MSYVILCDFIISDNKRCKNWQDLRRVHTPHVKVCHITQKSKLVFVVMWICELYEYILNLPCNSFKRRLKTWLFKRAYDWHSDYYYYNYFINVFIIISLLYHYHHRYHYPYHHLSSPYDVMCHLSLIHIWRCRRIERCRSRWSPYH